MTAHLEAYVQSIHDFVIRVREFTDSWEAAFYVQSYSFYGEKEWLKRLIKHCIETALLNQYWGVDYQTSLRYWTWMGRMVERLLVDAKPPEQCPYCHRQLHSTTNEVWLDDPSGE